MALDITPPDDLIEPPADLQDAAPPLASAYPSGMVEPGTENPFDYSKYPKVKNPDGSFSNVKTFSANIDGKEVLLPSMVGGKSLVRVKPDRSIDYSQAIDHYRKTGEHFGKFDTPENADAFANQVEQRMQGEEPPADLISPPDDLVAQPTAPASLTAPAAPGNSALENMPGYGSKIRAIEQFGGGPGSSAAGAFVRGAERSAAPSAAGMLAFGAGAQAGGIGGAALGALTGPLAPIAVPVLGTAGALVGGVGASMGASTLVGKAQDWLISKLPDDLVKSIGQDAAQQQADVEKHKYAYAAGELAPNLAMIRPSFASLPPWEEGTALWRRLFGHPVTARVAGVGITAGQEATEEKLRGEDLDPAMIALAGGAGALMNKPTRAGAALMAAGAAPVRYAAGRFRGRGAGPGAPPGTEPPEGGPGGAGEPMEGTYQDITPGRKPPKQIASRSAAPAPDEEIGLRDPGGGPPQAVTILGTFQDGRYTTVKYADGRTKDFPTDYLIKNLTDPPKPAPPPAAAPAPAAEPPIAQEGAPVSEDERFNVPPPDLVDPETGEITTPELAQPEREPGADIGEEEPPEPFRTTPGKIATEHAAEVSAIEAEAFRKASEKTAREAQGGTREAPITEPKSHDDIEPARNNVHPEPTDAQKNAENYRSGHVVLHGLGITIETPKGAVRRGPLDENGKPAWVSVNPLADYGRIKRTVGADSTADKQEQLDVYVGPNPQSQRAFVINQYDPKTGKFDETKSILGVNAPAQATAIYDAGFSDGSGPSRRREVIEMHVDNFRDWVKSDAGSSAVKASKKFGARDVTPTPENPVPTNAPAPNPDWTEIGKNADGKTLYQDQHGVRSYVENGVRLSEPVALTPTRGGMQISTDRKANPEYELASEKAAQQPPAVTDQAKPAEPSAQAREPSDILASSVTDTLSKGNAPILAKDLQRMAETAYGGTLASGVVPRDAMYDAAELGLNRHLRQFPSDDGKGPLSPAVDDGNAIARAGYLEALKNRMPTQTVRAGEKESHQQFSTPPDYSYAAAWVADLRPSDVVLEPSAGVGSFVVHALNAGVREVHANDLSERRAQMLRSLGRVDVTTENAEHLHAILPPDVRPTVVLMNPPFSAAATRMAGKKVLDVGAKHLEEALRRLEPGGRLVAIVGKGMNPTAPTFKDFWRRIGAQNDIRANVGVDGDIYRKYGTTFPTRLIVIDKVPPSGRPPVVLDNVKDAKGIIEALREVQRDRPVSTAVQQHPAQPGRAPVAPGGEGPIQPVAPVSHPTGVLGAGEGRPSPVGGGPGSAAGPSQPVAGGEGKRSEGAGTGVPVAAVEPERPTPSGTGIDSGAITPSGEGPLGGGSGGAGDGVRPDGSGERADPGVTDAPATVSATEESLTPDIHDAPITDAVYEAYKPQRAKIEGAKPHPGALVQSAAMASVAPPVPRHALSLPKKVIDSGALSDAQLEAVIYAGYAHSEMLPPSGQMPERRRGFFIGDGTGVGKGREVSGIILDNWGRGTRKHIWVSEKRALINDARRDWKGVSGNPKDVVDHGTTKAADALTHKQGILFTTYDTLKSAEQIGKGADKQRGQTRVQQIVNWVGPDFDGVIAFDEAHNLGNSFDMKGNRGMKRAAAKALAGVELQNALPKARVVYVSATGATEVENLAYADRLGLWGRGTAFADRNDFLTKVSQGGIAAMELVARDMKALGYYIARNLSYDGVEYDRLEHPLTPEQKLIYDKLADAWQLVLRNFNAAMEAAGISAQTKPDGTPGKTLNAQAKSAILSQFWGGHQRFFNQVITSMQMPTVLKSVEKDISEGRQAVLQLVNTNEAAQERALAKVSEEDGGEALEDLDMSPRDQLLQLVANAFPTQRFEEYTDESGNVRSRPVLDAGGNIVRDPMLVAARERLLDELGSIRVPDGPLEMLLNHFGTEKVAEVTGRKQRVVRAADPKTGQMRTVVEKRPAASNIAEANAFQEAHKPILVFSEAGGTGRSYHADVNSASAGARRSHYLVQAGWRADKAVQGFGRTHRTNQASAPIFHLVTTDLQGQKRFVSSIARRLGQLGALTKGERRTGNQGLFGLRDNLESDEAKLALRGFFSDVIDGRIEGLGVSTLENQMGLKLIEPSTGRPLKDPPPMTQFLNRLLSLRTETQNRVFDEFSRRMDDVLDRAAAAGTLDTGVETYKADRIIKKGDQVVYTDPHSGAETRHVQLETQRRNHPLSFDVATRRYGGGAYVRSLRSGKMFVVADATPYTNKDGNIIDQRRLVGPLDYQFIDAHKLDDSRYWAAVPQGNAEGEWGKQVAALPEYNVSDLHLITGAVLPIWDRLGGSPRIYRLQTDAGERMLGRVIPNDTVAETLTKLGAEQAKVTATPEQIAERVLSGQTAVLANGWKIKRAMVAGEPRIELHGPDYAFMEQLRQDGVFTERIDWKTRFFIPTGKGAPDVIDKVTRGRPVMQLSSAAPAARGSSDEEPQFQRIERKEPAPTFYSGLERAVSAIPQEKMGVGQWRNTIKNLPGVKKDEMDWLGLDDWLAPQKGTLDKSAILDFIKANNVQIKEVMKGGARDISNLVPEDPAHWELVSEKKDKEGIAESTTLRSGDAQVTFYFHPKNGEVAYVNAMLGDDDLGDFGDFIEAREALIRHAGIGENVGTKFGSYTLPGGENYRELLLTLPEKTGGERGPKGWGDTAGGTMDTANFRSGHFDEPNILAHVRFDDRTDADGKKTLFVEEIQSDMHQQGRRRGYKQEGQREHERLMDELKRISKAQMDLFQKAGEEGRTSASVRASTEWKALERERAENSEARVKALMVATSGVPDAPFKTTWQELAFKRMLRYAAENGYDSVSWTTGAQQADRYDLSRHISRLVVEALPGGRYKIEMYGRARYSEGITAIGFPTAVDAKDLADHVGKDLADKIVDDLKGRDGKPTGGKTYSGLDLKVGGEGMKGFYDKILPAFANKYGKKWGAKIGETKIDTLNGPKEAGQRQQRSYDTPVHSLPITPEMRESVMGGQPMFERTGLPTPSARPTVMQMGRGVYGEPVRAVTPEQRNLIGEVDKIAKRIAPTAPVRIARRLYARTAENPSFEEVHGAAYREGAVRAIAWSLESPNAAGTVRHEAVHYLRRQGLITPDEWEKLAKEAADSNWAESHHIDERYPGIKGDARTEEAVAEEFAKWNGAPDSVPPWVARIFARIRQFLRQIAAAARKAFGKDVTAHDIFAAMESGEVGARGEPEAANELVPQFQKPPTTAVEGAEALDDMAAAAAGGGGDKDIGKAAASAAEGFPQKGRPSKHLSGLGGTVERLVIFPRTLAATDWRSAKYWSAVERKNDTAAKLLHEAADGSKQYVALAPEQRAKLHAAEELARLKGIVLDDDGHPIVMRSDLGMPRDVFLRLDPRRMGNVLYDAGIKREDIDDIVTRIKDGDAVTIQRAVDQINPPLAHSKYGDVIDLDPQTTKAYFERRKLFQQRWRDLMSGAAKRAGWDGEPDAKVIREAAEKEEREAGKNKLNRIAALMDAMAEQERRGYVPLMRFGDYYLSVVPKAGIDKESLGGFPRTLEFRLVDSADGPFQGSTRRAGDVPKNATEAMKDLRKRYPESMYDIQHGYISHKPELLRSLDIPAIEKLLTVLGQKDTDLFGPMVEEIQNKMYEELTAGFKRRASNVAGYDPDFARASGSYFHWTSRHVAEQLHGDDVRRAQEQYIDGHPDRGTRQFWQDWDADQKRPATWMQSLQQFGFYWELAGNLSSSVSIALHLPEVATFTLGIGLGPSKTGVGVAAAKIFPAVAQVDAAIRANTKDGLHLDIATIKGLSPDERVGLEAADKAGLFRSTAADELMGMQKGGFDDLSPEAQLWQRSLKVAASNITVVDRSNRIALWLAAHRLAKTPGVLKKWNKVWWDNQLYREMIARDGLTPEGMARFMVDEAAFVWGKKNQPWLARKMPLLFQFQGFRMRKLSALWRNMHRMGPEGKLAGAAMIASTMALAGVLGSYFVGDLEAGIEWLYKRLTKIDPMIESHLYDMISSTWFGKRGAEAVLRGAPRTVLGIDLSNRLGYGKIVTDMDLSTNPVEALGVVPGILYNAVTQAANRWERGQRLGAVTPLLPAAVRNPYEGLVVYPNEGVRTQYQKPNEPPVVAPSQLDAGDILARSLGYSPSPVARAYEERLFYERLAAAARAAAQGTKPPAPYRSPAQRVPQRARRPSPYPQ